MSSGPSCANDSVERKMRSRLWLLLGLLVAGTTLLYVVRILGPWEDYVDVEHGSLKARLGDLYSPWFGSRELLLNGRNPYGPQVTREIQMKFYGRVIEQSYSPPGGTIDEQRFAYPVYAAFLLAPAVRLQFEQVQRWAPAVLGSLSAASVLLWLAVLRWRLSTLDALVLILFVLNSPQIVQGLRLRQLGLVVGFIIALAVWCVARNHLWIAGVLLALSTIKPQMVVLLLVWFAIWSLGDWRARWRLPTGFFGSLVILVVAGEIVLPGWLGYFFNGLQAYWRYGPTKSLLRLILGGPLAQVFSGLLACAFVVLAWRKRTFSADSKEFAGTLAGSFLVETIALPLLSPFNQVLLLLPVILILRDWKSIPRFLHLGFIFCFSWPWAVSLMLLLFPVNTRSTSVLPLLPSTFVAFVPLLLSPLMAADWRATR